MKFHLVYRKEVPSSNKLFQLKSVINSYQPVKGLNKVKRFRICSHYLGTQIQCVGTLQGSFGLIVLYRCVNNSHRQANREQHQRWRRGRCLAKIISEKQTIGETGAFFVERFPQRQQQRYSRLSDDHNLSQLWARLLTERVTQPSPQVKTRLFISYFRESKIVC